MVRDFYYSLSGIHTKALVISIVFSCWTRTLDLIRDLLNRRRASYIRIDGSAPLQSRKVLLDRFVNDDVNILLRTTGTGAVG